MKWILFKEDLFKLVVSGEKTQTRRVIKDVPPDWDLTGKGITQLTSFIHPQSGSILNVYPRYYPREIVYLKEPFFVTNKVVTYKYLNETANIYPSKYWKNKLFMPQKYARFLIYIDRVRVERLEDITGIGAIAEGFGQKGLLPNIKRRKARQRFFIKWIAINGLDSALENPWVFVYEFSGFEFTNINKGDTDPHRYVDARKLPRSTKKSKS